MLRKLVVAMALAFGAMLAAAPASAMPVDRGIALEAAGPQATQIRWVCNAYGRCRWVVPRRYYAPRYVAPRRYGRRCGWRWGSYGRRWVCW